MLDVKVPQGFKHIPLDLIRRYEKLILQEKNEKIDVLHRCAKAKVMENKLLLTHSTHKSTKKIMLRLYHSSSTLNTFLKRTSQQCFLQFFTKRGVKNIIFQNKFSGVGRKLFINKIWLLVGTDKILIHTKKPWSGQ